MYEPSLGPRPPELPCDGMRAGERVAGPSPSSATCALGLISMDAEAYAPPVKSGRAQSSPSPQLLGSGRLRPSGRQWGGGLGRITQNTGLGGFLLASPVGSGGLLTCRDSGHLGPWFLVCKMGGSTPMLARRPGASPGEAFTCAPRCAPRARAP